MKIFNNIAVFGNVDTNTLWQMINCAKHEAVGAALMADGHVGYSQPIGGVVSYMDHISPSGVGYDIACGNKAVRLDATADDIKDIKGIMDEVFQKISFGVGRSNAFRDELDSDLGLWKHNAWNIDAISPLKEMARAQLGTVGSGNHYVDIFLDQENRVWIGCHFGSRGLGHKIATHFVKAGGGKDGMNEAPTLLKTNSTLGQEYISAMRLAGEYAYAGRDWVCKKVSEIIGKPIVEQVHNHHNFAWEELHLVDLDNGGGYLEDVWVVRKGATPNKDGTCSFIGGTMCDISVITQGKYCAGESEASFDSTVHGAGRIMSRTQAAGKFRRKGGKRVQTKEGVVTKEMMANIVKKAGIELRGGGFDETPYCYKNIVDVLKSHKNTLTVQHTLTPVGVAMAGEDTKDPYKD